MRRIALFSDVHANLDALRAVMADIEAASPDDVFCLGDLVGYGPDPVEVVAEVRRAGIVTVRGNYDDGVGARRGGCGCYYATDAARSDGEASYAFTSAALSDEDARWLAALPPEARMLVGDVKVLFAHGSPRKINEYLTLDRTDEQLGRLAAAAEADVVCVGHVHVPYHRFLVAPTGPVHYANSGSVGKPKDGDPRACWMEAFIGEAGEVREAAPDDGSAGPAGESGLWVAARPHRVPYEVEAVAARMIAAGLPPSLAEALKTG